MNKQLINKYKSEFDHWLNEGKLLCYTEVEGPYYEVTDEKWDFVCDIGFIINDEYVEFRKALTEGKTIEYLGQSSNLWQELEDANFNLHQTCYRIKPDEPKFKVGDFVRYAYSTPARALEINNINGNRYYFTNSEMSCLEHELSLGLQLKTNGAGFGINVLLIDQHLDNMIFFLKSMVKKICFMTQNKTLLISVNHFSIVPHHILRTSNGLTRRIQISIL